MAVPIRLKATFGQWEWSFIRCCMEKHLIRLKAYNNLSRKLIKKSLDFPSS